MMTQKFRYGSSILILNLLHDAGKKAVQPDLVPEFSNGLIGACICVHIRDVTTKRGFNVV